MFPGNVYDCHEKIVSSCVMNSFSEDFVQKLMSREFRGLVKIS